MSKGPETVYVAKQSFAIDIDGVSHVFTKGVTRVRAGHPLLKMLPDSFEPLSGEVHYEVEDASAAPGRKRGER